MSTREQIKYARDNYCAWLKEGVRIIHAFEAIYPDTKGPPEMIHGYEFADRQSELWKQEYKRLLRDSRGVQSSDVMIPFTDAHEDRAFQQFMRAAIPTTQDAPHD